MTTTEIPKELFDATVKQQISHWRYGTKVTRDIMALINRADKEITDKIITKTDGTVTKQRLEALLKEIRTTLQETYNEAGAELKQQMLDFAGVQTEATAAMIATQLPVSYNIAQASAEQLAAIVNTAPITVGADKKLLLEEIFKSLAAGKEEMIRGAIRMGMVEGETIDQMVRRLKGTRANQYKDGALEVSRRHAETMTRTIVNHTSNQAMQATYKNNAEVVKGWVFTATLDGSTSLTCRALAGTVWPIGEGPIPPRHISCRSIAVPELKSWREMGIDLDELPPGMRASKDGPVSADISMDSWMRTQSKADIVDMLGPSRAKLFQEGMKITSFTDRKGIVYTLEELREKHSKMF